MKSSSPETRTTAARKAPLRGKDPRRQGREAALQILYAMELNGETAEQAAAWYWPLHGAIGPDGQRLAQRLLSQTEELSADIARTAAILCPQYPLERMAPIDRALLRLSLAEMLGQPHTPGPVIIQEAIRMSDHYARPEMKKLLNAVLDAAYKERKKKARE